MEPKSLATRKCSEMTLSALTKGNHNLIGGSADLAGSNNTKTKHQKINDVRFTNSTNRVFKLFIYLTHYYCRFLHSDPL